MKKKIIGIFVCMLLIATALPVVGTINGIKPRMEKENFTDSNEVLTATDGDWWPMHRHDLEHSGYSTSTAPDVPNVLWNYTTDDHDRVSTSPAVSDGKVYFGSWNPDNKIRYGVVYCLDIDGTKLWSYTTDGWLHSSPAVADGKVFIGSDDGYLYCLYTSNGTLDWKYNTGRTGRNQYVRSSPAVVDGKVFFGCADGYVYCLYASNGSLDWEYYISGDGYVYTSSPAIVDGKVFIGSYNGKVYCLNASTGIKIWESTYMDTYGYSSPAVADGKVYVGSYGDDSLYCLDASTGAWIWNYPTGGGVYSSPAVADGKIYFGSVDSNVYCLNTDGDKLWNYTTDDGVFSSPAIADGKVFIGSDDGNIYCLDTNGEELWIYTTDGSVRSCPAVADGKVFVGSWDGNVYCFGQPDTTPPEITDVQATPSIQTSGGYVNITATVTDDIAVDTVTVNITSPVFPAEEMINVPGTDTYYYNATYTEVGTYDYFIWADDTSENENTSDTYQFEIEIMCNIEIEISGGLGINAIIRNTGEEDVTDLEHSIVLDGGFILLPRGGVATGTIDIPAGDEVSIKAIVLGLGRSEITVTAGCAEETASGLVILLFVLGV